MPVHDFHASKRFEEASEARVRECLLAYFGKSAELTFVDEKFGRDWDVKVHGETYTVDVKVRSRDWGDELIELISNDRTGREGWALHAAKFDFIINVYPDRYEAIDGAALQHMCEAAELDGYPKKYADNGSYTTVSVAVPTAELRELEVANGCGICVTCDRIIGEFWTAECETSTCNSLSCCEVSGGHWYCTHCREGDIYNGYVPASD